MLIHCPTCSTSYEVKPSALGAAGRSVRCVRCRTVWFANARPPKPVVSTGRRATVDAPEQIAAAKPAMAEAFDRDEQREATAAESEAQAFVASAQAASVGEPMLDAGARALVMDATSASDALDSYEPITMADAPPLAPMDHDASQIPSELPLLTGVANRVDPFIPRRSPRAGLPAARALPIPSLRLLILTLAAIFVALLGWRNSVVAVSPQMASLYAMIGLPVNLRGLMFEDITTTPETHDGVPVLVIEGAIANAARTTLEVPRLRFAVVNASGGELYTWTALPARSSLATGDKLAFHTRLASPPPDGREVTVRFYSRRDATGGLH
jgi:predicted Zn finger-like uncharacterized protein